MQQQDFRGKRVTVVGLGIEGVDMVRYLHTQGALVTVSDARPAEKLHARLEQVADIPVRLALGSNEARDMLTADAVFVSQGVPLDLPGLVQARENGVPMGSMLQLFLERFPGPVVGITGSSGKTTVTALVGEMFRCHGRPYFVGGNIGVGLLSKLGQVSPDTWAILETSHTQLQIQPERALELACILNITPNHLDRFSWDDYRELKARILRHQKPNDVAVLGYDDPETRALADRPPGDVLFFSLQENIPGDGAFLRDGSVVWRRRGQEEPLFPIESLRLRGRHNWANTVAAAAVAAAAGIAPRAIASAAAEFPGVPHRLELVHTSAGIEYYNDSIATTPERTLAALHSFQQPLVLLLGGRDKHLPLDDLAREASRLCRGIVLFGESGSLLEEALRKAAGEKQAPDPPRTVRVDTLAQAVEAARGLAQPGDAVVLSPAGTSYDAYANFEERGNDFRRLVTQLTQEVKPSTR